MAPWRAIILESLLFAVLLAAGCGESEPPLPGMSPEQTGPEIQIEVRSAPKIMVGFPDEVGLIAIDGWKHLLRGKLRFPSEVTLRDGQLVIGGKKLPGAVRIILLDKPGDENGDVDAEIREDASGPNGSVGAFRGAHAQASRSGSGAENSALSTWEIPPKERHVEGFHASFLIVSNRPGDKVSRYRGLLDLYPGEKEITAVNVLRLEEYLAGVVGAELGAWYPKEALKAQAVCSRTYALYALRRAEDRDTSRFFADGQSFQVYRGVEVEHPKVIEAIASTRGEVLTYLQRLFRAYYHSTCGGQTARSSLVLQEPDIPPLAGTSCGFCGGTSHALWEETLSVDTVTAAVRRRMAAGRLDVDIGEVSGIEVAETGSDGRALYVRVEHSGGSFEWRADCFRRGIEAVSPQAILSTSFDITKGVKPGQFIVRGRGWGHGMGLCQIGCARMGNNKTYREILAHYYPKSTLRLAY